MFLVVEQFDADLLFAYKAEQALFDQLEVRFPSVNELLLLQLTRDERIPLFVLGCTQFHQLLECLQRHEMVHCKFGNTNALNLGNFFIGFYIDLFQEFGLDVFAYKNIAQFFGVDQELNNLVVRDSVEFTVLDGGEDVRIVWLGAGLSGWYVCAKSANEAAVVHRLRFECEPACVKGSLAFLQVVHAIQSELFAG